MTTTRVLDAAQHAAQADAWYRLALRASQRGDRAERERCLAAQRAHQRARHHLDICDAPPGVGVAADSLAPRA